MYGGRLQSSRGYALLEILIAAAIASALLGVLFQFAVSAQAVVGAQGEAADVQQRLRVALENLRHDLMLAGAGVSRGPARGPLVNVFPPIVPARLGATGADPELSFHDDRITIVYVPDARAQSVLAAAMAGAGSPLSIDGSAPGCAPATACSFAPGDDVLVFEPAGAGGAHERFVVAAVDTARGLLTPAQPLSRPYARGSAVVVLVQRTYHLDRIGKRLMTYDGVRTDLPLVDHVVDLHFAYYGDPRAEAVPAPSSGASSCAFAGSPPLSVLATLGGTVPKRLSASQLTDGPICGVAVDRFDLDLLRIRRIVVTIRVEAESASVRGTGPAFATAGFSRAGVKQVPDLQATIDVAPRNMLRW